MQDLLPVAVVAKHLCISRKRVYQFIEMGRLDALRLGVRTLRITRDSVDRLVADQLKAEKRKLGLDLGELPTRPKLQGIR